MAREKSPAAIRPQMNYETRPLEQQKASEFCPDLHPDGYPDITQGPSGVDEAVRDRESFSERNRRLSQQIDPETQERVQLMTKKQYMEFLKKSLRAF